MSQGAILIADDNGAAVLAALNAAFARLNTTASGSTRPSDAAAGTIWLDTNTPSVTVWTLFFYDGISDIALGTVDSTTHAFTGSTTTQAQANNSTSQASTAYADRIGVQQTVRTQTGAVATGTTVMPYDDTIPQNTEGDQYMSLAITPKSATSILRITAKGHFCSSGANLLSMALFQDSIANALAATGTLVANVSGTPFMTALEIIWEMVSGTTSPTTFKVRAGGHTASTTTFNGESGARLFGGVANSSIEIEEIGV